MRILLTSALPHFSALKVLLLYHGDRRSKKAGPRGYTFGTNRGTHWESPGLRWSNKPLILIVDLMRLIWSTVLTSPLLGTNFLSEQGLALN